MEGPIHNGNIAESQDGRADIGPSPEIKPQSEIGGIFCRRDRRDRPLSTRFVLRERAGLAHRPRRNPLISDAPGVVARWQRTDDLQAEVLAQGFGAGLTIGITELCRALLRHHAAHTPRAAERYKIDQGIAAADTRNLIKKQPDASVATVLYFIVPASTAAITRSCKS